MFQVMNHSIYPSLAWVDTLGSNVFGDVPNKGKKLVINMHLSRVNDQPYIDSRSLLYSHKLPILFHMYIFIFITQYL